MLCSVWLSVAAVLLQYGPSNGHILRDAKREKDNLLLSNDAPPRRRLHKYVRIQDPLNSTRYGDSLVVECHVAGYPAPSVSWTKNGITMAEYEEETNEVTTKAPSSIVLLISRLVTPAANDGDIFTCVGVSDMKETSAVTVYGEDADTEVHMGLSSPVITEFYRHIIQDLGTSVTLPCRVYSTSRYQVAWLRSNGRVVNDNARIRMLPSGDLYFREIVWEDMDEYTCVAKNMYGKTSEITFLYPKVPSLN